MLQRQFLAQPQNTLLDPRGRSGLGILYTVTDIVDLRSDTVTRPTPEMYAAMASAPLGDDVLGDDPTVTELERLSAQMFGKEAAVFVPSGTMGNQVAIATHTNPGDAMIVEEEAHVLYYEVGAPAILNGVLTRTVPSKGGIMDPADVERAVMKRSLHTPGTALLVLENTHNRAGGTILPLERMDAFRSIADKHGFKVHLDGARVFNASVALGLPVADVVKTCDSVSFCLSKGLASPVGSVLVGSAEFIDRARIWRKRLGGGMRQAGVLAACGIVSLMKMVDRLGEDHARAKRLGAEVGAMPGLTVDQSTVQTNMVLITTDGPSDPWLKALQAQGVWALPPAENRIRCVFHNDVDDAKTERAIEAFRVVASRA